MSDLTSLLVAAQRSGQRDVDQSRFAALDRATAYDVQRDVQAALGVATGVIKTAIHADGLGVAAPIYAGAVGRSGEISLPLTRIVGLEVEIGMVLSRDVLSSADLASAIDHYFVGIEVCGTRLMDRKAATPAVGLADNMSAYGYVIGDRWALGSDIDGLEVVLALEGREFYRAPAKHGFGSVLASLAAYADNQVEHLSLRAGAVITTGSMCGLVPLGGTGVATASFGDHLVRLVVG